MGEAERKLELIKKITDIEPTKRSTKIEALMRLAELREYFDDDEEFSNFCAVEWKFIDTDTHHFKRKINAGRFVLMVEKNSLPIPRSEYQVRPLMYTMKKFSDQDRIKIWTIITKYEKNPPESLVKAGINWYREKKKTEEEIDIENNDFEEWMENPSQILPKKKEAPLKHKKRKERDESGSKYEPKMEIDESKKPFKKRKSARESPERISNNQTLEEKEDENWMNDFINLTHCFIKYLMKNYEIDDEAKIIFDFIMDVSNRNIGNRQEFNKLINHYMDLSEFWEICEKSLKK